MGESSGSSVKLGLWLSFLAFQIIVVVFRSNLKEISLSPEGGVKATLVRSGDVQSLSEPERNKTEQELMQRLNLLEQKAREEPQTRLIQRQIQANHSTIPNLAGNWRSAAGLTYVVNQFGNYISVQELNPMLGGVTAVATGQIEGPSFNLPAYTLAGTTGVLSLHLSEDETQLTGQYRDNVVGSEVPMLLSR
jgi:hypothetical protein